MRTSFHEDLDKISEHLVEMTRLAGSAMSLATTALLATAWAPRVAARLRGLGPAIANLL